MEKTLVLIKPDAFALHYSGDIINGEIWHEVDNFDGQTRSDEELIESWFK